MAQAPTTSDREIILSRSINAPRALVFKAFTTPEHVDRWWGPNGFITTTISMDMRPGGMWRFTMRGPDGTVFPNRIVYTEVLEPERIAYDHSDDVDGKPPLFQGSITFEEQGAGTLVTLHAIFPTAAARDFVVREVGAIEGGKQTLARLEQYVNELIA